MLSIIVRSLLFLVIVNDGALAAGNPAAGEKKSAVCQGCHGEHGISVDPTIPKLAGQFAEYIAKQINDFQIENRRDPRMSPMAATVTSARDLADIAAYFASQKPMRGIPLRSPQVQLGRMIFEAGIPARGVPACAGCHGAHGKGMASNAMLFPVIGGQHRAYIIKQLNDFRLERRHTDLSGTMTSIGQALTMQEVEAIADYVSGL